MATTVPGSAAVSTAAETVYVDRFCDGIIGPSAEVLGTVRDGGHIVANTAPGCWGPMITPGDQGRPRGDAAGERRGRRGRRRDRDPDPLDRRDLDGDRVGQRPHDRGPLQRRSVLREGLRPVRRGGRGDRRRRHRPRQRALRGVRCAGRPVRVHQRLHDGLRRGAAPRRDRRRRAGRGVRARRRARRVAAVQLGRRTRSCCSPRPTSSASWRGCGRSWASSARCPRSTSPTRTTRATSAPSCSGPRTAAR